jgi:hypothetical protein
MTVNYENQESAVHDRRNPRGRRSGQRSVPAEVLRKIAKVEPSSSREELQFALRLAGINTVDLYELNKEAFVDGKICCNRTKTKVEQRGKAYMEIKVMEELLPLFAKYEGHKGLPHIIVFCQIC